jgi:hypothetical protein
MSDVRVCIRDPDGVLRKITKIAPYKHDRGFAAMVPYHTAKQGFLLKHSVRYDHPIGLVPCPTAIPFSATDRVKLSIHLDGFVQFSGQDTKRIVSGRDSVTGQPKGIGLVFDHPIDNIRSGPLFGIILWGLHDFAEQKVANASCLEFALEDVYSDRPLLCGEEMDAYLLEFFIFPNRLLRNGRRCGPRGDFVRVELPRSDTLIAYRHDLRVIDLPGQRHFLGCLVSKASVAESSPSGYSMSGPSFAPPGSNDFVTIRANYPSPDFGEDPPDAESLDRSDSSQTIG